MTTSEIPSSCGGPSSWALHGSHSSWSPCPRDWALLLVVEFRLCRGWAPLVVVEFHLPPTLLQGHPDVARALLHQNRADANHEATRASTKASVLLLVKGACHIQVEAKSRWHLCSNMRSVPTHGPKTLRAISSCWDVFVGHHPVSLHLTL